MLTKKSTGSTKSQWQHVELVVSLGQKSIKMVLSSIFKFDQDLFISYPVMNTSRCPLQVIGNVRKFRHGLTKK